MIPEDISKTVRVKDAIALRSPWPAVLVAGSLGAAKCNSEDLPVHQFPGQEPSAHADSICAWPEAADAVVTMPVPEGREEEAEPAPEPDDALDPNPDLRAYRRRTVTMLRRYLRYSLETGRVPSLLGGEYFRTGVTSYGVVTFEDRVIFVHDMESCLQRLDDFSVQLIARHTLQEHDLEATARLLHCNEKTIRRAIPAALDQLSEILLEVGLMEKMNSMSENSCQGGQSDQIPASDCEESEKIF
jgi:DNA-directed RNA polymerase specialized sigma24 family protein